MASTPPDDVTDLSGLTPRQRYELLEPAARLAATGLYENVVLSTYAAFHNRRVDRFVREMGDAVAAGRTEAIRGPLGDQELLEAVLRAGTDLEPGRRLEPADVDRQLGPGRQGHFANYLRERLAQRGGHPPSDPKHWLQMYTRADALHSVLRVGAFADVHNNDVAPPELSQGLGRQALAVQKSRAALSRHKTAVRDAELGVEDARHDLGLGYGAGSALLGSGVLLGTFVDPALGGALGGPSIFFLIPALAQSAKLAAETTRRGRANRQVAKAERAVAETTGEFGRALGPVWPDETVPQPAAQPDPQSKRQPRRGRA